MRALGALRGTRTVGVAWVAGVILIGALLAFGGWTIAAWGVSGSTDERAQVPARDALGGETVVAKLDAAEEARIERANAPKPTPHATELPPAPSATPTAKAKAIPNLDGLSEIPQELLRDPAPKKDSERKAFAAFSKASEVLPWDAVEPVPFEALPPRMQPAEAGDGAKNAALGRAPLQGLPASADVERWVKSKVTEIKGEDRKRPLLHFELWLEPPAAMKQRLVGVDYDFNSPAILPQQQASSDKATGFRVSAGGLACADEITLTLKFDDGRSQKVAVDGCQLMG
ncbi:MAG: hypothetical protein ACREDO_10770 [Methyloceanibacter sp.]